VFPFSTHRDFLLISAFVVDAFSFKLGYAQELAAALIKLQIQNLSSMVRLDCPLLACERNLC
jgi:Zn-dependent protease with chaperone function